MRMMGIDYGTKRVGVAITDETGTMAFPRDVFVNDATLTENITKLATSEQVEKIIVGHSLTGNGETNPVHDAAVKFIGELTLQLGIPIELEPEQYTTKEALHIQGRTDMTDASAAALILNSYITKNQN